MLGWMLLSACHGPEGAVRSPAPRPPDTGTPPADTAAPSDTAGPTTPAGPCADDAVLVGAVCVDRYEAPNVAGADPLVMMTFLEAESWCGARGKRLCFDDEWEQACAGPDGASYPYGDVHQPGVCNDDETWRVYDQSSLSAWPFGLATDGVTDLEGLYTLADAAGGGVAVAEVRSLYQAEGSGTNPGCGGAYGVYDLVGNVEEWTRRRDGGAADFHGNLKGRYWAESRTCGSDVTVHGDSFRFYEIGFRCCADPAR